MHLSVNTKSFLFQVPHVLHVPQKSKETTMYSHVILFFVVSFPFFFFFRGSKGVSGSGDVPGHSGLYMCTDVLN